MRILHLTGLLACSGLFACGASTPPPATPEGPTQQVASASPAKQHGSGTGGGKHGHKSEAKGNKDGVPGGASQHHGSGEGGGRNGGKPGEAKGNHDGRPGGTSTEHGSGHGAGRGGGKKDHSGDKNGVPGTQSPAAP